MGTSSGPKYIPYTYMDLLGYMMKGAVPALPAPPTASTRVAAMSPMAGTQAWALRDFGVQGLGLVRVWV